MAISTIRKMEEFDIAWVEEPVHKDDFAGKAKVARILEYLFFLMKVSGLLRVL